MLVRKCDLCDQEKDCLEKEIDGVEYDICAECWEALAAKLKGKGRKREREMVYLPPVVKTDKEEPPKPRPGEPPIIWGGAAQ